ncbi:TIGR03936 family radical SAM-associated protein [Chloroflexota bacterium]
MQRLRVRFARGDEIKFISHLDIMRLWERTLMRAEIRISYSEGFSPHPRLSIAAPLAVGIIGESELIDVYTADTVSPHWFTDAVNKQLPVGISILGVQQIGVMIPSLQSQVRQAEYRVVVDKADGPEHIESSITSLLSSNELRWYHERDTGKREYDLRELIDDIRLESSGDERCTITMVLRCGSNGSGRPEQVTLALGFKRYPLSISRTKLILGN